MAQTGIARIDDLFMAVPGTAPVASGDTDRIAVGAIQDLLAGLGNPQLPDVRSATYGTYGPMTIAAVQKFRSTHGLPAVDVVDSACLASMVRSAAADPRSCPAYIALALDMAVGQMTFLACLTGLWECSGRFALLNRNTDRAGLSFGVIQWAQKPGRLREILAAFQAADADRFANCFGGSSLAAGLLAHVAKPNGGLNPATGTTIDPAFDLISPPWVSRFQAAGLDPVFQRAQIAAATAAGQSAFDGLKNQTTLISSRRGIGFLLDVANQHGPAGAVSIYRQVFTPALTETALLQAMRNESVRRITAQFGAASAEVASTSARRDWFLTTAVLA